MKYTLAVLGFVFSFFPALLHADTSPLMFPTRDVIVTITSNVPVPTEMKISYQAATHRTRTDMAMKGAFGNNTILTDYNAHVAVTIMHAMRTYKREPQLSNYAYSDTLPPGAKLTRKGTQTILGLSCTAWDAEVKGRHSSVCLTDDGVMLQAQAPVGDAAHPATMTLQATKVEYGPLANDLFTIPEGYKEMPSYPLPTAPGQIAPRDMRNYINQMQKTMPPGGAEQMMRNMQNAYPAMPQNPSPPTPSPAPSSSK
jgi:hypothetical protein